MELFGVSPIELLFIAILGLIIFGPERLPEIGRFLGRTVARVLAWQYTSPEAQMLTELRRDIEQQIVDIRDEMVYARQQLDVRAELTELQRETESLLRGNLPAKTANTSSAATTPAPVTTEPTIAPPAAEPPPLSVPEPPVSHGSDAPAAVTSDNADIPAPPVSTSSSSAPESLPTRQEIEALTEQIQTLSATLQNLQEQLRQRGLLDPTWQSSEEVPQEQIV